MSKPKLEVPPKDLKFPEPEERSWDMDYTLEPEFPEEAPPGWYEINYDRILKLPFDPEHELRARLAFTLQCKREGLTPVGDVFCTTRFWCLRVRDDS